MLRIKNWKPKNDNEKPGWDKYKYHESAKLEDLCCLALNKAPPHILMLSRPNGDQYQYFGYRILGNNKEFFIFEELVNYVIGSRFIDKYNRFYRKVAEQLGLGESLPPLPLIESLDYSVDSIRYETKVKKMIYDKALKENWWGSKGGLEISNEALTLANHIHSEAFIYEHVYFSNDIRENLVENGGTLNFLEGTRRLMFSDFEEWADSKGIELPEGFPGHEVAKIKAPEVTKGNTDSFDEWMKWRIEVKEGLSLSELMPYGFQKHLITESERLGFKDDSAVRDSWVRLGIKPTKDRQNRYKPR